MAMYKRILSFVLVIALLVGMVLPVETKASETDNPVMLTSDETIAEESSIATSVVPTTIQTEVTEQTAATVALPTEATQNMPEETVPALGAETEPIAETAEETLPAATEALMEVPSEVMNGVVTMTGTGDNVSSAVIVHFYNSEGWSAVNACVQSSAESDSEFPGIALEENAEHEGWFDLTVIDNDGAFTCIFTDGTNQTDTISVAYTEETLEFWYVDGALTSVEPEQWNAPPVEVSRIQWIQSVVKAFSMTVAADNYPDNYYSDLTGSEDYYRDIMIAVEFGIIDLDAGLPFRPDDAATREFAAQTLNYALGFQLGENATYTFSESAEVTYPDDIQVAINRGWFELADGAFLPEDPITAAESETMLADVENLLIAETPDVTKDNSSAFAEGVIEIPQGTRVSLDENGDLVIAHSPVSLKEGDVFVAYDGEFPVAFVATAVREEGSNLIVSVTTEGAENAITDVYYSGTIDAKLEDFVPAEATTFNMGGYNVMAGATTFGIDFDNSTKTLTASKNLTLTKGLDATIECVISNIKLDLHVDQKKDQARAEFSGTMKSTFNIHGDPIAALGGQSTVTLGYVPILFGTAHVEVSAECSLSGEISLVWEGDIGAGFSYSSDEFRLVKSFNRKAFSFSAELNAKVGARVDCGIDLWVLKANVWASAGAQMDMKDITYGDGKTPERCKDFDGFLYIKVGASATIFWKKSFSKTEDIYKRSNSPIRVHYHHEDGIRVNKCTRGSDVSDYSTPEFSKYYNNSYGNVSSTYTDSSGNTVKLYEYTLDENNRATITKYNGSAYALSIPAMIDGYTVVSIKGAFQYNTSLGIVKIPNTVTTIDDYAFFCCRNLISAVIPNSVTTFGHAAFMDCEKLITTIPKNVEIIGSQAFQGCRNLSELILVRHGVVLEMNAFANCVGIKEVYVPDSAVLSKSPFSGANVKLFITRDTGSIPDNFLYDEYGNNRKYGIIEIEVSEGFEIIGDYAFAGDSYNSTLKRVILPESIREIGEGAFSYLNVLEELILPMGSTGEIFVIKRGAFRGCYKLKEITLPTGITEIPEECFYFCGALKNIVIPETVTKIGKTAFEECTQLSDVVFPDALTSIGYSAFWGTALAELTIPDAVTEIGPYAFRDCASLKKVKFGSAISEIPYDCFSYCTSLTTVDIPSNITEVGSSAFAGCTALETVYTYDSTSFSHHVFDGDNVTLAIRTNSGTIPDRYLYSDNGYMGCHLNRMIGIKKIIVEEGITSIGINAFASRDFDSDVAEIQLPETIEEIGAGAFWNCNSLSSINIPSKITAIPDDLFLGCSKLESVNIHDRIMSIGDNAFQNCTALTEMIIPDSVTELGEKLFSGCTALKTVRLPVTCKTVTDYMFQDCSALASIQLPAMVTTISNGAFKNCDTLTTIGWPNKLATIGSAAFQGCDALASIAIPDSVTSLGTYALAECTALMDVTLPVGITTLSAHLYDGCTALKSYQVPDQITKIESYVFQNCDALTDITLPEGLTSIGNYAFYDSDALPGVVIPETVSSIGNYCFYDCDALRSIDIPDSVASLGNSSFYSCDLLADVQLGDGLTTIPDNAFMDCQSITTITLPRYLTTIKTNAFSVCPALVKASIPASVTSINASAFSYPDRLVIYGIPGSYAETFAAENGFQFADGSLPATSVTLNHKTLTMSRGTEEKLVVIAEPADHTDSISWKSSNTSVATVTDRGVVKAVGTGSATIRVTVGSVSASCKITVVEPVTGIRLDKTSLSMQAQETYQLTATVTPADANNRVLSWTSSNPAVASVDETGLVTALTKGATTITATATDGTNIKAVCTVTVTNDLFAITDIVQFESSHNYSNNCTDTWTYTLENAEKIAVTFDDRTEMEDGFDHLRIYDGDNNLIGTYTGTELAGQTIIIPHNTICIQLDTDEGGTAWGFKVTKVVDASELHEHSYGEWVEAVAPTCTEKGKKVRTCECGNMETLEISATGHIEAIDAAVEPTCTETGLTEGKHCSVCNAVLAAQEVLPALGHSFSEAEITKTPTCTEEGIKTFTCTVCGENSEESISAQGHSEVADSSVAPTCTTSGLTEGSHCEVCGEILVVQEIISANGHSFEDGFCGICGAADKADYEIFAGKGLTLKEINPNTGKAYTAKEITWSLAEEYEPFATLTAAGKLTAKKVFEKTGIVVEGTLTASGEIISRTVDIFPVLTQMEVVREGQIVANNVSIPMDETGESMTFRVNSFPEDTLEVVEWTVSDKKDQFAQYAIEGDVLTISDPTGKAGTVTIKATVNAGVKKTVTFKIQLGSYARTVEIEEPEKTTIRGGETLALSAVITKPEVVTKPGIVWSVSDKNAATITNGKLKAKAVTHPVTVTVTAASKDGQASDTIDIRILPKTEGPLVLMHEEAYVTNGNISLNLGETYTAEAYSLQGEENIGEDVTWTTSKAAVAEVDENGAITAMGGGTAKITAQAADGRKASLTVKVSVLVDDMELTTKDGKNLIEENGETMVIVPSGKGVNLTATVLTEGAAKTVTWELVSGSHTGKLATTGKFTANKDLTDVHYAVARATAKDGSGYHEEITLKVVPIAQGIQIYEGGERVRSNTIYTSDLDTNSVIHLTARVYPAKAMQEVQWTSSNKKVAYFDEFGDLVCVGVGSTNITVIAADGSNQKSTFKLTVVNQITSISLKDELLTDGKGDLFVAAGKSLKLTDLVEISPSNATNKKLAWSVSRNNAGIKINASGVLSTKKVTEPVTVKVLTMAQDGSGEYLSFDVTVYPATAKLSIHQDGKDVTSKVLFLKENESISLTAVSQPDNAAGIYSWESTDEDYVYVDETGTVTALQPGKVITITCKTEDSSGKKATVKIKVI